MAIQPRRHVPIPVSSTNHSSVEAADTEYGGLEGLWKRRDPRYISPWRIAHTDFCVRWEFGEGLSDERPE